MNPLLELSDLAYMYGVVSISDIILKDPRFVIWSGSSKPSQHHYGTGGLAVHTFEVVELCKINNRHLSYPLKDRDIFLAALFHDVGKMWDYEPVSGWPSPVQSDTAWRGTIHKRRIHHISRSALVWSKAVESSNSCREIEDEITHAILSHHGRREWGSPVAPHTPLAWLLHLCDGISARMNDCERNDAYLEIERK